MFAPKYETSSDLVTYKKVAQSNQRRKGCQIIIYFTLFKNDSGAHRPPKRRERERERERKREREREKYVHQEGTAVDPVEKVLMSFLFFFNLHFLCRD